eukprot:238697-Pleurochrysis_carterae.AAC.1
MSLHAFVCRRGKTSLLRRGCKSGRARSLRAGTQAKRTGLTGAVYELDSILLSSLHRIQRILYPRMLHVGCVGLHSAAQLTCFSKNASLLSLPETCRFGLRIACLLYTSPSPRDGLLS